VDCRHENSLKQLPPASTGYPAWGLSWTYDRYGNRTAQGTASGCAGPPSGITCPTNSLTISATTNQVTGLTYEANGFMLNDGYNDLADDAAGRLVSSYNGSAVGYIYDGNGLRVEKCVPGCSTSATTTTVYIFSGSKVIAEYVNGAAVGSPTREYIYAGTKLLATISSSATYYHHGDHLSPRLTTDSTGSKAGEQGHFPFGESWYASSTTTKYQFTSYERDNESGNDYAMARYYVNRLGRYISPDLVAGSVANPQSLNRYIYAANQPLYLTDPLGLYPCFQTKRRKSPQNDPVVADGGGPSGNSNEDTTINQDQSDDGCDPINGSNVCATIGGVSTGCTDTPYGGDSIGYTGPSASDEDTWDYSNLIDGDNGDGGTGGGGSGTGVQCTFNIKINNRAGVSGDQLTAAENRIAALFGPKVGVNFVTSGNSDYALNMVDASPKNENFGQATYLLFLHATPAVYVNNITNAFSSFSASTVSNVLGTVGTHELVHRITGIGDLPYDQNNPNDLMSIDNMPKGQAGSLLQSGGLQLTGAELQQLLSQCLKKHPN
jgi:RHS repeat-associated protein